MDKMKKFKIKGVLDGLRSSVNTPAKTELDITETLRSEHFEICKVRNHGINATDTRTRIHTHTHTHNRVHIDT